jgi:hypothetical protein
VLLIRCNKRLDELRSMERAVRHRILLSSCPDSLWRAVLCCALFVSGGERARRGLVFGGDAAKDGRPGRI